MYIIENMSPSKSQKCTNCTNSTNNMTLTSPNNNTQSRLGAFNRRDSSCTDGQDIESGNLITNSVGANTQQQQQQQQQITPTMQISNTTNNNNGGGKRRLSMVTYNNNINNINNNKHLRTAASVKRRRKSIESDSRGEFDSLPNELVEAILLKLDAPALASLQASSKYFKLSGICDRVARFILASRDGECGFDDFALIGANNNNNNNNNNNKDNDKDDDDNGVVAAEVSNTKNNPNNNNNDRKRATVGSCKVKPQDSAISMLRFKDVMERAERTSSLVSLGSFHTVKLGDIFDKSSNDEHRASRYTRIQTCGRGFHGQLGGGGYEESASFNHVDVPESELESSFQADEDEEDEEAKVEDSKNYDGGWFKTTSDSFVQVSAGSSHCAALTKDGKLVTWGLASSGELGHQNTPIEVAFPKRVRYLNGMTNKIITKVACGSNHTLAITEEGELFSCGRGRHGQLGLGYFHDGGPMTRCDALRGMRVINIAAGGQHSVCVTDDGRVWSWGDCRKGQLGLGDLRFAVSAGWHTGVPWPCLVESLCEENLASNDVLNGSDSVTKVSCGKEHTMFLTQSGKLYVSGSNRYGALGINSDRIDHLSPVRVHIKHHVRKQDGTTLMHRIRACACVTANQLGGNTNCRIAQIACGGNHSLVLTACGAVFAAGSNSYGQLGLGDVKNRSTFSRVWRFHDKKMNIISVSAGEHHSAAIVSNQTVLKETDCDADITAETWFPGKEKNTDELKLYQWGRGDWGQLGHGETRGKWWPTLAKTNSVLAKPSRRCDFVGYQRNFDDEARARELEEERIRDFEQGGGAQHHMHE
jgi:E3 ubiquitin-protein ligase HERC3